MLNTQNGKIHRTSIISVSCAFIPKVNRQMPSRKLTNPVLPMRDGYTHTAQWKNKQRLSSDEYFFWGFTRGNAKDRREWSIASALRRLSTGRNTELQCRLQASSVSHSRGPRKQCLSSMHDHRNTGRLGLQSRPKFKNKSFHYSMNQWVKTWNRESSAKLAPVISSSRTGLCRSTHAPSSLRIKILRAVKQFEKETILPGKNLSRLRAIRHKTLILSQP